MSSMTITRPTIDGFEAIHIHTGVIEFTIIPALGGKISSLRDARTGREWLWRHPRFAYKQVPHGSSYVNASDTGGWDECFPSVAECVYPSAPWQGASIQDHGELWSQSADVVTEEGAHSVKVTTRWQGVTLPYAFTRTITLSNGFGVIHTNYQVTNTSDEPVHFVWCIHPLLAIEPGMELLLPAAADFHVNAAAPEDLVSGRTNLKYPFKADGLNLPALPKIDAGIAIKLWSDPLPAGEGMASLLAKDGEFKMRWDVNEIPQVAAWLNLGKWAADGGTPYYNLGLEPCIGAQDSLNDAVNQYNLFANLPPRGSRSWNLEIELTA